MSMLHLRLGVKEAVQFRKRLGYRRWIGEFRSDSDLDIAPFS